MFLFFVYSGNGEVGGMWLPYLYRLVRLYMLWELLDANNIYMIFRFYFFLYIRALESFSLLLSLLLLLDAFRFSFTHSPYLPHLTQYLPPQPFIFTPLIFSYLPLHTSLTIISYSFSAPFLHLYFHPPPLPPRGNTQVNTLHRKWTPSRGCP